MIFVSFNRKPIRAAWRACVFLLKVLPTLPSRPLDLVTPKFTVEVLEYPTKAGVAEGQVYRPTTPGPHPGIVVCLGVVPFGVDHPQVPRLGEALARAGFAALLYWSSHMRDFRLDPEDIENIAQAYARLIDQSWVGPASSGLLGTCVGGSFALMAAASPRIRDRVAFVAAFAPYGSLISLARGIASSTCVRNDEVCPWQVDPLTRKVFVHSVTALLEPGEAEVLREAFEVSNDVDFAVEGLSENGRAVYALLASVNIEQADEALRQLPTNVRDGLRELSPVNYLQDVRAPLIAISQDRDDTVIPVGESRLLRSALSDRHGVHYAEFEMFQHADPTKRKLSPLQLARQLAKFYSWLHGVFRAAVR